MAKSVNESMMVQKNQAGEPIIRECRVGESPQARSLPIRDRVKAVISYTSSLSSSVKGKYISFLSMTV